jgi:hypothetical protein
VYSAGVVNGVGDCDCIGDWECIAGLVLLVRQKKHLLQLQGMHDFCHIHFGFLLASLMSSQLRRMPMSINCEAQGQFGNRTVHFFVVLLPIDPLNTTIHNNQPHTKTIRSRHQKKIRIYQRFVFKVVG